MSKYEIITLFLSGGALLVLILGFFAAWRQLGLLKISVNNSIELSTRQTAMDLIGRYNDSAFIERRVKLRVDPSPDSAQWERRYLMNYLEEVAIAVKHGTANATLVRDFFGTIVKGWLEEDDIVEALTVARKIDRERFINLLKLYKDWNKEDLDKLKIGKIPELMDS